MLIQLSIAQKIKILLECGEEYILLVVERLSVLQWNPIQGTQEVVIQCLLDHLEEDANAFDR